MLKTTLFFLLVLLLLIPTLGGSLVLWLFIKNKFDKHKVSIILNEAEKSYQLNGQVILLKNLNNVSMKMIMNELKASDTTFEKDAALGLINHSEMGEVYLVMMAGKKGLYICTSENGYAAKCAIFKMDLQLQSIEGMQLTEV